MDAIGQLSNYEKITHYLKWIPQAAAKRRSLTHPIIGILQDQRPWAETYLSKMESDLAILSGSVNLDQVASRMENQEQFYDERAALGAAADYNRKGFQVDFIPESTTKRPDFRVVNPVAPKFPCFFEVKHIAGNEAIDSLRQQVRAISSPYVVDVHVGYLHLASQARHIGIEIAAEIEKLANSLATPTAAKPYRKRIFDCEVKIYLKLSGKVGPTTVGIHWSSRETFERMSSTLSRIIEGAREQLSSYMPHGVNIILLDVDRAALHDDEVYDVLYSKDLPGLFTLGPFDCVTALKFVLHVIPPKIKLFRNQNNSHVKSGLLATLGL